MKGSYTSRNDRDGEQDPNGDDDTKNMKRKGPLSVVFRQ